MKQAQKPGIRVKRSTSNSEKICVMSSLMKFTISLNYQFGLVKSVASQFQRILSREAYLITRWHLQTDAITEEEMISHKSYHNVEDKIISERFMTQ